MHISENWNADKRRLICIDIEKSDARNFEHGAMSSNPYVLDIIYKAVIGNPEKNNDQWWMKTGKVDVHLENDTINF